MMEKEIKQYLEDIEQQHGIKILYACESGSRGWGFPSPDSDYDVRFIYIRPCNDYLGIETLPDHLDFPLNDQLDIYGWDLRKVLRLMARSNVTPFEWLQSPVVYYEAAGFRQALWSLCPPYFNARSNTFHYLGIAKGAMAAVTEAQTLSIKKLFYILRPLLAAQWCVTQHTIAPMHIDALATLLPETLRVLLQVLIVQKAEAAEAATITLDPAMRLWIDTVAADCRQQAQAVKPKPFSAGSLNQFFRKTIYDHDYRNT